MEKRMPAKRVEVVSIRMVREKNIMYAKRTVDSPANVYALVASFLDESDREQFLVICVDNNLQPTNISVVSIGALTETIVHPREIFKTAILSNAKGIIFAHNHPSGSATPSDVDISVTKRLVEGGAILGIEIYDHVIIGSGSGEYISMKEKGII